MVTAPASDGKTTIRDVLTLVGESARVIVGHERLDDPIRWVHVTDLPDPAPYLSGGELILTSALWYRSPQDAAVFAASLASRGVHALGVALVSGSVLPAGLAEACADNDVLLVQLPDISFMDISELVITKITEDRRVNSVRAVAIEQTLAAQLDRDAGPEALIETLRDEVGVRCWVVRRDGEVIPPDQRLSPSAAKAVWEAGFGVNAHWRSVSQLTSEGRAFTVAALRSDLQGPVGPQNAVIAYEAPTATVMARQAVCVTLASRFLPLALSALDDRVRAARHVVADELRFVEGTESDPTTTIASLTRLGLDPARPTIAVCVTRSTDDTAVCDALVAALRFDGIVDVTVASFGGRVIALSQVVPAELAEFAERTWQAARHCDAAPLAVGVARQSPTNDLRRLLVESSMASVVGQADDQKPWAVSDEAGWHLLLLAQVPADVKRSLYASTIEPLLTYDASHDSDLVHTLSTFIEQACSWHKAAAVLHLHVNSLRYRIRRIEALTGRDLSDMGDRVDLFLGLRSANLFPRKVR